MKNQKDRKGIEQKASELKQENSLNNDKTPFFIFRKEEFRKLFKHFSQFGKVFYPVKANDHIEVLKEVEALSGCFEVDGIYHIERLLSIGVSPEKLQFSIPIKKPNGVKKALKYGVNRFIIDTEEEYLKIGQNRKNIQFIIRVSIADILNIKEVCYNKWGIPIKRAIELANIIENDGNHFLGISFYLSQEIYNSENFSTVLDCIAKNFKGRSLSVLDIGGGLDDSFSSNFHNKIKEIKELLNIDTIIVEPGRNLLDPCIDMVVSVIGTAKRGDNMWAYIDAGIYSGLLDYVIKDKVFEISILDRTEPSSKTYKYLLSGPTSDALDFLGEYSFKKQLNAGDKLIIKNCGAYTFVLGTHFSGFNHFGFKGGDLL